MLFISGSQEGHAYDSYTIFVLQNSWSPLYAASFNGHCDVVKALIEAGADINHITKVVKCN